MFAMLSGAWPRVTASGVDLAALEAGVAAGHRSREELDAAVTTVVSEAVRAQVEAGMGLVTDGHVRWADPAAAILRALATGDVGPDGMLVRAWRATAAAVEVAGAGPPAAQAIPGPYSLAWFAATGSAAREATTMHLAASLAGELAVLAKAGCPLLVVEEPAVTAIGADPVEGAIFVAAQERLLADLEAVPRRPTRDTLTRPPASLVALPRVSRPPAHPPDLPTPHRGSP